MELEYIFTCGFTKYLPLYFNLDDDASRIRINIFERMMCDASKYVLTYHLYYPRNNASGHGGRGKNT